MRPDLVGPLFSPHRGLVTWTPVAGLGLAGLLLFARRHRRAAVSVFTALGAMIYIVGAFPNWRGDASFGARYLIGILPLLGIGLAALNEKLLACRAGAFTAIGFTVVLAVWNYLLLLQYGTAMIPRSGLVPWGLVMHNVFIRIPLMLAERLAGLTN